MRDMELELEDEYELESEDEQFLGTLLKGVGGAMGLDESEFEGPLGEGPYGEAPLGEGPYGEGPLGEGPYGEGPLGEGPYGEGPLGEGPYGEGPLGESEFEFEAEDEFFFKKIGGFLKKAAPILKRVAKFAAPIVGTAIGGPLGGKIGSFVGNAIREGEFEDEFELETGYESEAEFEAVMEGPLTEQQGLGELMAAIAANAATDTEAEAQIGGAVAVSLSPRDRDALKSVLPSITRGAAILTRILRRQPSTRIAVRTVPTIVKRTATKLKRDAAAGRPVTKKTAARTMAKQTRKVLATPSVCAKAVQRNARATRATTRATARRTRPDRFSY